MTWKDSSRCIPSKTNNVFRNLAEAVCSDTLTAFLSDKIIPALVTSPMMSPNPSASQAEQTRATQEQ
jgi:hypothetical protein